MIKNNKIKPIKIGLMIGCEYIYIIFIYLFIMHSNYIHICIEIIIYFYQFLLIYLYLYDKLNFIYIFSSEIYNLIHLYISINQYIYLIS
jgi:hypothetical protein